MAKCKFGYCMIIFVALLLQGCATTRYYAQAVKGQTDIIIRSQSIERLIQHADTPLELESRLVTASSIVNFAADELNLPHNGSYQKYADLNREHVVWNVVAAPELSVSPKTWCFPIAGCLGYRGYFSRQEALNKAESLRNDGFDVYVAGVDAYSTLGFLNDPLLNTFLDYPEADLAGLIFHELTHQKVYIKDDFVFNESLATAVELFGVEKWLSKTKSLDVFLAYERRHQYRQKVVDLMLMSKEELDNLYRSQTSVEHKTRAKEHIFAKLKEELRFHGQQFNVSGKWLDELTLNNAVIASYATYYDYVPVFQRLLDESAGELEEFFLSMEGLKKMTIEERSTWLESQL